MGQLDRGNRFAIDGDAVRARMETEDACRQAVGGGHGDERRRRGLLVEEIGQAGGVGRDVRQGFAFLRLTRFVIEAGFLAVVEHHPAQMALGALLGELGAGHVAVVRAPTAGAGCGGIGKEVGDDLVGSCLGNDGIAAILEGELVGHAAHVDRTSHQVDHALGGFRYAGVFLGLGGVNQDVDVPFRGEALVRHLGGGGGTEEDKCCRDEMSGGECHDAFGSDDVREIWNVRECPAC